jgi:hypothetical protein
LQADHLGSIPIPRQQQNQRQHYKQLAHIGQVTNRFSPSELYHELEGTPRKKKSKLAQQEGTQSRTANYPLFTCPMGVDGSKDETPPFSTSSKAAKDEWCANSDAANHTGTPIKNDDKTATMMSPPQGCLSPVSW